MHELTMAMSIMKIVDREAENHNVSGVQIVVGELSGVDAEALQVSMNAVIARSRHRDMIAHISSQEAEGECVDCGRQMAVHGWLNECPACGSCAVRIIHGTELKVMSIDIADAG